MKNKSILSPSQIYVKSVAWNAFSGGLYIIGLPVFLWMFFSQHGDRYGLVSLIISFKFLLECFLEIASSYFADMFRPVHKSGMSNRLFISMISFAAFILGYACLAVSAFMVNHVAILTIIVISSEFFRGIGNSFISGTFDAWAISLEKNNPNFSKSKMFTDLNHDRRIITLIAAVIAVIFAYITYPGTFSLSQNLIKYCWAGFWALTVIANLILILKVYYWAIKVDKHLSSDTIEKNPPTLKQVINVSIHIKALAAMVLTASLYLFSMLLSWTWPKLFAGNSLTFDAKKYAFVLLFLALGILGSHLAKTHLKKYANENVERLAIFGVCSLCVTFLALGVVLIGKFYITPVFYFVLVVCLAGISRVINFYSFPFVSSVIHDNIEENEEIRASIVSIRSASSSFLVFLGFLFISSTSASDPLKSIGYTFIGAAVLVLTSLFILKKLHNK